jgi:2-dehydropantoate 2-reductase
LHRRSKICSLTDVRVAVIGAGGVGGYYGALLARAGHEVRLLARGAHLAAIRERGLTVRTPDETFTASVEASDDSAQLDGELAIVAVKNYSLDDVTDAVSVAARRGAAVLPLLNGVEVIDRLEAAGVPHGQIVGGLTYLSAFRVAPGVIQRHSPFQRVTAGELDGRRSDRIQQIAAAFAGAGVEMTVSDAIQIDLWRKFMFLAAMSATCGLARRPIGAIRASPMGRRMLVRAVSEIAAVARASGIEISSDDEERTLGLLDAVPAGMKPSFLVDLEQGNRTELDALSGSVSRLGERLGVSTPVHDSVVGALS